LISPQKIPEKPQHINNMKTTIPLILLISLLKQSESAFVTNKPSRILTPLKYEDEATTVEEYDSVPATDPPKITLHPEAIKAKAELINLADVTKRGFSASRDQRKRAQELVKILEEYNPTSDPAAPYYKDPPSEDFLGPNLCGKWTLIYTDAPDITGLDGGPLATAKLGRIGQECDPPFIKNIIEWKRPEWAKTLPFSGSDESKVIQKVACEAQANRNDPLIVNLKIAGLDLLGVSGFAEEDDTNTESSKSASGGPGKFFEENPVELRGIGGFTAPFGRFKVMYLDEDMRVIRTGQNFLAVNVRNEEDWF